MVRLCWLVVFFLCAPSVFAETSAGIGFVQTLKGSATIQRDGQTLSALPGGEVYLGDLIRTAANSAVGVVLEDDTTISMGPESEFMVTVCEFSPKDGKLALVLRMLKGTFSYISGVIAKLAPESVRMEIPDGTIAVRGTKLLVDIRE